MRTNETPDSGVVVRVWDGRRAGRVLVALLMLCGVCWLGGCRPAKESSPVSLPKELEELRDAMIAQAEGRYAESLVLYEAALKIDPKLRGVHYQMGVAAFQLDNFEEARKFLAKSIKAKEEEGSSRLLLGVMLAKEKNYDEARKVFEEAGKLIPDDPQVPFNLGQLLRDTGRPQDSLDYFRKAVRLKPDEPLYAFKLRLARIEAGEESELVDETREQLTLASPTGDWMMTAAAINLSRSEWDEAARLLERAARAMQPQMFFGMLQDRIFTMHAQRKEIAPFFNVQIVQPGQPKGPETSQPKAAEPPQENEKGEEP